MISNLPPHPTPQVNWESRTTDIFCCNKTWPVCHVIDNTNLYLEILRTILSGQDPGHGKRGYFLASPGNVAWDDLYTAMAAGLAKRNVVGDASVVSATPEIIKAMGDALSCPPEYVAFQLGGK